LLDAGRADTRDLLEAEESLLSARNAATGALVDWVLARMSAYLDMERLVVEEDGIVLLEPPASLAGRPRQGSSG
jgi:outer membrane protein TolC